MVLLPDKKRKQLKGVVERDINASILERFPKEIIHRIFVLAGLNNNLPLLNRHIHSDLSLKCSDTGEDYLANFGLVRKVIEHNFVHDMNHDVEVNSFNRLVVKLMRLRIPNCQAIEVMSSRLHDEFSRWSQGIDIDIWNYRFLNCSIVDRMNLSCYGVYSKHSNPIVRRKVIQEASLAIEEIISGTDVETNINKVKSVIDEYSINAAPYFPKRVVTRPKTNDILELMNLMKSVQKYQLKNTDLFVSLIAHSLENDLRPDLVQDIIALGNHRTLTGNSISQVIRLAKKHDLEEVAPVIRGILEYYYFKTSRPQEDLIWREISQLKSIEIYEFITELSGAPKPDLLFSL